MTTETITTLKAKLAQLEKDHKSARTALEKQIADAQKSYQGEAIAQIKALMAEHGLTAAHLQGSKKIEKAKTGKSVAPKYRGPEGQTWTGRGRQPKWVGENRDQYKID